MKLEPPAHAVHTAIKKIIPRNVADGRKRKGKKYLSALLPYLRDPLMSSLFLREP